MQTYTYQSQTKQCVINPLRMLHPLKHTCPLSLHARSRALQPMRRMIAVNWFMSAVPLVQMRRKEDLAWEMAGMA